MTDAVMGLAILKTQRLSGCPKIRILTEPSVGRYCLRSFTPVLFEPASHFITLSQIGRFKLAV